MTDKERIDSLENVLARMLRPVAGIPFSAVIKALSGCRVIAIEDSREDRELMALLDQAAKRAGALVCQTPIRRPRPNEVGNDMEPFVLQGLRHVDIECSRPLTKSGLGRSTGYPDILIRDKYGRYTYIECKIYSASTKNTTQRSFYLSPSEDFKVSHDARHVVFGYEMIAEPVGDGSRDSFYTPVSYSIIDVHDLGCDVKYEFNSDNRRLYGIARTLAQGSI